MERHRRGGLTFDYTRLIVRPRGETLDPLESQSGVLIFCGSVKLPIKYSSRLFNCRNKEEQRASRSPTAIRGYDALRQPFQTPLNGEEEKRKEKEKGKEKEKEERRARVFTRKEYGGSLARKVDDRDRFEFGQSPI